MGGKSVGMGWLVAKTKTKKQDDTNGRVYSGCDIHMHPQGQYSTTRPRQTFADNGSHIRSPLPN